MTDELAEWRYVRGLLGDMRNEAPDGEWPALDWIIRHADAMEIGLRVLALEQQATEDEPIMLSLEGRWMTCLHLGDCCYPMRGGALDALRLKDRIDAEAQEAE